MKPSKPNFRILPRAWGSLVCAVLCLGLFGLSACSLPGARSQPIRYFVLEIPPMATPPMATPPVAVAANAMVANAMVANAIWPVLLLREAEPGGFGQNLHLIYSRAPGTLAQYQFAFWNEAPPRRLQTLLRERLLASGLYAGVLPLGSGVQGEYQINFRLHEFFHNAAQTPGSARVKLEVELIHRGSARLLAQRMFVAEAPLASGDAAGAAAALGQASGQALDAVIAWLRQVQPTQG